MKVLGFYFLFLGLISADFASAQMALNENLGPQPVWAQVYAESNFFPFSDQAFHSQRVRVFKPIDTHQFFVGGTFYENADFNSQRWELGVLQPLLPFLWGHASFEYHSLPGDDFSQLTLGLIAGNYFRLPDPKYFTEFYFEDFYNSRSIDLQTSQMTGWSKTGWRAGQQGPWILDPALVELRYISGTESVAGPTHLWVTAGARGIYYSEKPSIQSSLYLGYLIHHFEENFDPRHRLIALWALEVDF